MNASPSLSFLKRKQEVHLRHAEAKAHVDALEDVLKKQQAEMEQATRELEETMISHQKKREMLRQRRSQRQLELDAEIEKTQAQVATEEAEVQPSIFLSDSVIR